MTWLCEAFLQILSMRVLAGAVGRRAFSAALPRFIYIAAFYVRRATTDTDAGGSLERGAGRLW